MAVPPRLNRFPRCRDVVVVTADRRYWITLYTSGDDPGVVAAYDPGVLAPQLHPWDALD